MGKDTISYLQRYLGTPADGRTDNPSVMVKALQKRLNEGAF
jgi:hypothetical protein